MEFPKIREGKGIFTIPEMLENSAREYGENVALQMRRGKSFIKFTYEDLLRGVKRLAAFLKKLGFSKGDRAGVIGENCPEWGICYLAILWAGGVVVPLDPRLTQYEWRHIVDDALLKVLFCSDRFKEDFLEIRGEIGLPKEIIPFFGKEGVSVEKVLKSGEEVEREKVSIDDLAVILYTSGTTGKSKGVMLSNANIMSNVNSVYQIIDFGPSDNFFSILPLHHIFEATAGFITPLYGGATITYARSLKSRELREDMLETKPTCFLVVPLLLEKIVLGIRKEISKANVAKKGIFYGLKGIARFLSLFSKDVRKVLFKKIRERTGFGNARYIVSGGAALPKWVSKELEEMGFPIFQGYGLSETSPVLTFNPVRRPKNESVGLPIPGVEIKIVDKGPDGVGEIAAKGPNIMMGYYKNEKATRESFTEDGWFLTGDLGYIDEEGYLYITGRKKSVIVTRGGKNIYPEEVENELLKSPYIEEVLVLRGANPKTGGEEVHAIVFPNYENLDEYFKQMGIENPKEEDVMKLIGEEIRKYSRNLADYKRPKFFTIREEEFPKTTTRKIKRYLFEKPKVELE